MVDDILHIFIKVEGYIQVTINKSTMIVETRQKQKNHIKIWENEHEQ